MTESEANYSVIVNFSNPYILQNEVLSELISLSSSSKIQLIIITTNYFEPQDLSSTLTRLHEERIVSDFKIIRLYSKMQSPKGRPLQKYLMNMRSYFEIKRIYLKTKPNLSLFHSTNELADLIGMQISKKTNSNIGILRPTSCEIPEELKLEKRTLKSGNISLKMFRKCIYTYERLTKTITHLMVMKSLNYKEVTSKGFHSKEISDFALCANQHDARLLREQIESKVIDVVHFSSCLKPSLKETKSFVLILLPFLESLEFADHTLSEMLDCRIDVIRDSNQSIYIKHHPRTPDEVQAYFHNGFSLNYHHEEAYPTISDLDYLVENARWIICVGETSAGYFAYKRSPHKITFTREVELDKYLDPLSVTYPTMSQYLLSVLHENSK